LPGDSEAAAEPGEFAAESVVADGHEGVAVGGEGFVGAVDFLFGVAVDEEGDRGGEGEAVFDDAGTSAFVVNKAVCELSLRLPLRKPQT